MLALFRNIFAPPRDLILLVIAAWLGLTLSEKRSARHGVNVEVLNNLILIGLTAYILGGRLFFAAEHLGAFAHSPLSLISLNIASFDMWGASAAALIAGLAYGQHKKLPLWHGLDALTPFFASLAVGLGFLHLASGAAFGRETNLPWGIDLWGARRHPTQVYEILASLVTLGLLWFRKAESNPGNHFLSFVALTSAGRVVIESFRGDSTLVFGGLRLAQLIAWAVLGASLAGLELPKSGTVLRAEPPSRGVKPARTTGRKSQAPPRTKSRPPALRKTTQPRRSPRKK